MSIVVSLPAAPGLPLVCRLVPLPAPWIVPRMSTIVLLPAPWIVPHMSAVVLSPAPLALRLWVACTCFFHLVHFDETVRDVKRFLIFNKKSRVGGTVWV